MSSAAKVTPGVAIVAFSSLGCSSSLRVTSVSSDGVTSAGTSWADVPLSEILPDSDSLLLEIETVSGLQIYIENQTKSSIYNMNFACMQIIF